MNGVKPWTKSTAMLSSIGVLVSALVMILNAFGIHLGVTNAQLVAAIAGAVSFAGGVGTFLGRLKANTTIVSHSAFKQMLRSLERGVTDHVGSPPHPAPSPHHAASATPAPAPSPAPAAPAGTHAPAHPAATGSPS